MLENVNDPIIIDAGMSGPIPLTDAVEHVRNFETTQVILLPTAWAFDATDLLDILTPDPSTGRVNADGVRFYASIEPGYFTIKLIAVGIKKNATGGMDDMCGAMAPLYNFSRICPNDCDTANSPLRNPSFNGRICK